MTITWTMEEVKAALTVFPFPVIQEIGKDFILLGITRGGTIPAQLLQSQLNLHFDLVTPDITIKVLKSIINSHKYVMFIDDINDSGATIDHFMKLMSEAYPNAHEPAFQFWTLIKRNGTKHPEALAAVDISDEDWVEFPWDKDEPHVRTHTSLHDPV